MSGVQFGNILSEFGSAESQFGGTILLSSSISSTLSNATSAFSSSLSASSSANNQLLNSESAFSTSQSMAASASAGLRVAISAFGTNQSLISSVNSTLSSDTSSAGAELTIKPYAVIGSVIQCQFGDVSQFGDQISSFLCWDVSGLVLADSAMSSDSQQNITAEIGVILENCTSEFSVSSNLISSIQSTLADATASIFGAESGGGLRPRILSDAFEVIVNNPMNNHVERMGQAYKNYAESGIVLGVNLLAGGDSSILENLWYTDNTDANIDVIASKMCNYWRTMTEPGQPAHGGTSVISVSVDISESDMAAKIGAMITDEVRIDGMYKFIVAHQEILESATWNVTELVGGVPTLFTESIS